jgi:hypothetical protein
MKYGDEREMLLVSLPIVEALFCWVNGKSFSFEDSRKIDRKNATALWTGKKRCGDPDGHCAVEGLRRCSKMVGYHRADQSHTGKM